jgi:YkoY family integral membrane protein
MWGFELRDAPLIAWYTGVLAVLEGLLSADNALVLALMVRHLTRHDQRRVLRWGLWGAVGFRVIAVLLATNLVRYWIFKVIGGGYLLYLAIAHFYSRRDSSASTGEDQAAGSRRWLYGFWGTVLSVTMADIAFSIDSILAAVAMADSFPDRFGSQGKLFIVLVGGVLGIITMRFLVRPFVALLDRFPGLAEGAYYLVAWIGLKLMISGFHDAKYLGFHIEEWLFWSVMLLIAVVSLLVRPRTPAREAASISASLELLDSAADSAASDQDEPDSAASGDPQPADDGRQRS